MKSANDALVAQKWLPFVGPAINQLKSQKGDPFPVKLMAHTVAPICVNFNIIFILCS